MKNLIASCILILGLASCKKVIQIKTDASDVKTVIVASIKDGANIARVKVSKSVNLNDKNTFPYVSGAIVTITDDAGGNYILPESSVLGTYELPITGVVGRTYTLTVNVAGTIYTASSKMFAPIPFILNAFASSIGPGVGLVPTYVDPAGERNYSNFTITTNDTLQPGLYLRDDEFSDGVVQTQPLFGDYKSESGDSILVVRQTIDATVYEYLTELNNISDGGSGSNSPANPKSNFNNGAFGYFSAYSSTSFGLRLP
jgi:hypothetical protein